MKACGKVEFVIEAFDLLIHFQCPTPQICDSLDHYLFPPLPRHNVWSSPAHLEVSLEQEADKFRIFIDGELVASEISSEDLSLATVKALDDALVHRIKRYRAIHAGAVAIDGRAVLLPGSTHAGKSSLVAELLRRGASYLSDEYALIDSDGLVHAYPRPLLLRDGRPIQSLVLPEELNSSFARDPLQVGCILALEYTPGGEWKVHKISQSEAVMLLLRNTPHELSESPQMTDFFLRVAGEAICFEGTRGDATQAVPHILELVRRK